MWLQVAILVYVQHCCLNLGTIDQEIFMLKICRKKFCVDIFLRFPSICETFFNSKWLQYMDKCLECS